MIKSSDRSNDIFRYFAFKVWMHYLVQNCPKISPALEVFVEATDRHDAEECEPIAETIVNLKLLKI